MTKLCAVCDDDAGVTLQRQIDPAAVSYCLQHAAEREQELKIKLENYQRVVVVALEPSELEQTQARLAELERGDGDDDQAELETALRTLEQQGIILEATRRDLAESREAFNVAQRELERTRKELERVRGDLTMATRALELARGGSPAPATPPPITPAAPAPATRPDPPKP
jgi:BMFP domain-containing protein YqiC